MGINYNSIKRLENTLYSIEISFKKFEEAFHRSDEREIYLELGNLLLWVLTADEWLKKNDRTYISRRSSESTGDLLKGLRHAYNLIKHDVQCIQLHEIHEEPLFSFPITGTFEVGLIYFVWAENKEFEGHKSQKKVYLQEMVGQSLKDVFEKTIPFIEKESKKFIK